MVHFVTLLPWHAWDQVKFQQSLALSDYASSFVHVLLVHQKQEYQQRQYFKSGSRTTTTKRCPTLESEVIIKEIDRGKKGREASMSGIKYRVIGDIIKLAVILCRALWRTVEFFPY